MKYSLVIHANGDKPTDYKIYLTDSKSPNEVGNWWAVGLIQNIKVTIVANSYIPKVLGGFVGISILECKEPDLSSGINVFIPSFGMVNEIPIVCRNIYISNGKDILGSVQGIDLDVDVNGNARLCIRALENVEWKENLPAWVIFENNS